jgi:MYXO-CTERM domain-containing protein
MGRAIVKVFATTGSFNSAWSAGNMARKSCDQLSHFISSGYSLFLLVFALAVLFVSFSLAPAAKAETLGPPTIWDYSFSTDNATCAATGLTCISTSGNVVFTLELVSLSGLEPSSPCVKGGWEEVVGMTGSINGAAISFAPADVSSCGVDELFLPSQQQGLMRPSIASILPFTAGGLSWNIFAPDTGPYGSSVLIDNSAGQTAVINWDLVDPPTVTPEPSSIAMALAGLVGLVSIRRGRRLPKQTV